jgi:hypothetical protein
VSDTNEYQVLRSQSSGSGYAVVETVTGTTDTDTGLNEATRYYYRVRAVYPGTNSQLSNEADAATDVSAPVLDTLNASVVGEITVEWSLGDSVTEGSIEIYRSTDGSLGSVVTTIADLSTTSWTDTAVADGRQYQYTVRRVTPEATADSGQQSATTILPAPTGLAVDSVDDTGGTVSWTSNTTGATGHRIEVREDNTGSWTVAETGIAGDVESASVTGLRNGQLYGLRVVALAPDAESIDYEPDVAAGETLAIASGETYQFEKPHVNSGTVDNAGTMQPDDTQ